MPRPGLVVTALIALAVLPGCQTGERPYFNNDPFSPGTQTGDAAIDDVLETLDAGTRGPVTANYTVVRSFDPQEFAASVAIDGDKRAVTLGNAKYVDTPGFTESCTVDGSSPCVDGLEPQLASNTQLTIDFYGADTATKLRRDASAAVGPATSRVETFAGQPATCVDVPLPQGTASYCVTGTGLVALRNDGAVVATLVGYDPSPIDPATFAASI